MSVAIFGGTFDPIHRGHVEIARAAANRFGLEQVLFVPSGRPPHKRDHPEASYEHRFRMAALACKSDPRFRPSRLEAPDRGSSPHYSVDTIRRAGDQLVSGEKLFFITGSDAFAEVTLWYEWRKAAAAVEFIVVSRPGAHFRPGEAPAEIDAHWLSGLDLPISSTDVRERLRSGVKPDELLPTEIAEYIVRHGLYVRPKAGKQDSGAARGGNLRKTNPADGCRRAGFSLIVAKCPVFGDFPGSWSTMHVKARP